MTTKAIEVRPPEAGTISQRIVALISRTPVHVVLIAIAILWLVPSVGLLITSFRPRPEIASSGWWEMFRSPQFTFDNYQHVLEGQKMASSFVNSLLITIPSTLLPLFLGALAAFAFSWIRFPLRDTIFLVIVALMIIPIQMALVPDLTLFSNPCGLWSGDCREVGQQLRLTQSYGGIWLAHTAFALPFAIFLLRNFFITLPRDLIEAARVDGASNFGIFWRVILPLSVPALASFGIFQFLWVWNDLLNALVFIQNSDLLPLTVRITQVQGTYGAEWDLLSSGAFVLMFVPLIVFFALQRYFVQGLLAGSVK
ncbi:MAG: carbohydrate ABC transporter permease [Actinomycetota bacterium]|nr:carbohydrate ABC transporter permease [Actinomycetota bacterium]